MYKFIFKYFYYLAIKRNPYPRYIGVCYVTLAQYFHGFLLLSLIRYSLDFILPSFSEDYYTNKILLMPFMIIWLIIVNFYYNKNRMKKILEEIKPDEKIITFKNTIVVTAIIVLPLLIGIKFINMSVG